MTKRRTNGHTNGHRAKARPTWMPYVTQQAKLLADKLCGFCGMPLAMEMMKDRLEPEKGRIIVEEKGEHLYCRNCHTFWPEAAISGVRDEARRQIQITRPWDD